MKKIITLLIFILVYSINAQIIVYDSIPREVKYCNTIHSNRGSCFEGISYFKITFNKYTSAFKIEGDQAFPNSYTINFVDSNGISLATALVIYEHECYKNKKYNCISSGTFCHQCNINNPTIIPLTFRLAADRDDLDYEEMEHFISTSKNTEIIFKPNEDDYY